MRHAACAVAQHAATEKLAIRRLLAAREAERRQRAETRIGESERHCAAGAEHQKAWLSRTGVGQGEGTGSLKGVFARGGLNGATRVGGLSSPQKRERERERERGSGARRGPKARLMDFYSRANAARVAEEARDVAGIKEPRNALQHCRDT